MDEIDKYRIKMNKKNCFWDDWMQNAIKVYSETEITNEQVETLKQLGVVY